MTSPTLRTYAFTRAKDHPKFIPFLVYLHPPPSHHLTPSQADYWTHSLIAYYPEALKDDVLEAIAMDPGRITPLIPYLLSKFSATRVIFGPQIGNNDANSPVNLGSSRRIPIPDPEIRHVPQSTQTERASVSGGIGSGGNFNEPCGEPLVSTNLREEIDAIRNAIALRVDKDAYHLSVSKTALVNMAYGFLLGAFSFLELLAHSYNPHTALLGSVPLALALLLVFEIHE